MTAVGEPGCRTPDRAAYAKGAMPYEPPTHTVERSLRATTGAKIVAGVDEVGRGAWAGPVTVCAAITGLRRPPQGLTDSKLLTVKRRTELAETLRSWVTSYALGHALPEEIDELGMTAALRLAAVRALEGLPVRPDAVILDAPRERRARPQAFVRIEHGDDRGRRAGTVPGVQSADDLARTAQKRDARGRPLRRLEHTVGGCGGGRRQRCRRGRSESEGHGPPFGYAHSAGGSDSGERARNGALPGRRASRAGASFNSSCRTWMRQRAIEAGGRYRWIRG
ncbi:Ribonuclease HII [Streptomyces griseoloalbus]